tara:strand:- start:909 stop:1079 length:171 start_codon:yes stop_codon:yes gene_type:complete
MSPNIQVMKDWGKERFNSSCGYNKELGLYVAIPVKTLAESFGMDYSEFIDLLRGDE